MLCKEIDCCVQDQLENCRWIHSFYQVRTPQTGLEDTHIAGEPVWHGNSHEDQEENVRSGLKPFSVFLFCFSSFFKCLLICRSLLLPLFCFLWKIRAPCLVRMQWIGQTASKFKCTTLHSPFTYYIPQIMQSRRHSFSCRQQDQIGKKRLNA